MFTATQVIEALRKIVKGKEDYLYESPDVVMKGCAYTTPEKENFSPSCGIGWAINALDPELLKQLHNQEWVYDLDTDSDVPSLSEFAVPDAANAEWADGILFRDHFTGGANRVMRAFQFRQDRQKAWGEALEEAEKMYRMVEIA